MRHEPVALLRGSHPLVGARAVQHSKEGLGIVLNTLLRSSIAVTGCFQWADNPQLTQLAREGEEVLCRLGLRGVG